MKAPRTSRDWSLLPTLLLAALLVVIAGVAGLWWWSGTQASLEWALQRIARSQPLAVEGVQGTLRDGLQIRRLAWERDGLKVEADNVQLAWQPLALLEGTIKLKQVHMNSLRITNRRPPSPEPFRLPDSLLIRPAVELDDLVVGKVEWIATRTFEAEQLSGRYWFDGKAHWVRLNTVRIAGGNYGLAASLGADAPLPLDATLRGKLEAAVPGAEAKLPLEFTATLQGPLADLQARAQLRALSPAGDSVQANASARIAPFAAQPLAQAQVDLDAFDLAALWPQAPHTLLAGQLSVTPAGTATWHIGADLRNGNPGPWDQQQLPLSQLQAQGQWRAGTALVQSLDALIGDGSLKATGQWQGGSQGWTVHGDLSKVDPSSLHSQLAAAPLAGRFDAHQDGGGIAFDVALRANGNARKARKPLPARRSLATSQAIAAVAALELRQISAKGHWNDGRLSLPTLAVRSTDAHLQGSLDLRLQARAGSGRLELQAPGLRANVSGELSDSRGRGNLLAESGDVAQLQRWLQRLPAMPAALREQRLAGRANAQVSWQGGWRDPVIDASVSSAALEVRGVNDPSAARTWAASDVLAHLNGRLSDASLTAHARARQGQRQFVLDLSGRSGREPLVPGAPAQWHGRVASATLSAQDPAIGKGAWQLALQRAVDVRWSPSGQSLDVTAGQAVLAAPAVNAGSQPSQAVLAWDPVRWRTGELHTAGRLTGLPMAWLELAGGPQLAGSALSGDMVFDAQWDASLGRVLKLNASLTRSRGDVTVLAETSPGVSSRVAAGVRDARLVLTSQGDQATLYLRWDSERAGVAEGRLMTRLSPGGPAGWQWPATAPVSGTLRAQLPRIGVWSLLAPPGWRLRGSLAADVKAAGTRGNPQLSGTVAADDLALRSVVDGIELRNGLLRARLDGNRLLLTQFTLHGAGEKDTGGTLEANGEAAWVNGSPSLQANAQLTRLRASTRTDRELTVSGNLSARMDNATAEIRGRLKVDQARLTLPDESEPKLGDDVVVRNAPAGSLARTSGAAPAPSPAPPPSPTARPLLVAVDLDLGDDFRVRGRGLQTRLRGTLALAARSLGAPQLTGTITAVGGEYSAYGQRLDVERGVLRFTGRIDNPSLDVLAVRPNLAQRVGVLITGNAQAPFIRLYAEPELPDAEKLAWLVTGRAAPSTGAEAALVQQAALALLSSRRPGARSIAAVVGLDELSVRRDSSEGAVVTLGKRFASNFYASYERSLSGALGTLYIFYDVSRRLTVRAQAGERAGVDLIFTFSFD